jgi:hypothetical protein
VSLRTGTREETQHRPLEVSIEGRERLSVDLAALESASSLRPSKSIIHIHWPKPSSL